MKVFGECAMRRIAFHSFELLIGYQSFGAIGIDWATGRKLQQVERDSQHASRCGKRETRRRPETVATVVGLQMRPLWKRV